MIQYVYSLTNYSKMVISCVSNHPIYKKISKDYANVNDNQLKSILLFMDTFYDKYEKKFIENEHFYYFVEYGVYEETYNKNERYYCGLSKDLEFIDVYVVDGIDLYDRLKSGGYTLNKSRSLNNNLSYKKAIKERNRCNVL